MPCVDVYPTSHVETPRLRPRAEPVPAMLSEVFAGAPMDGAATGFVLAQLGPGGKPVLWVQDRMSRREAGRPCLAGMRPGVDVLRVDVPSTRDALWAAEQGLDCPSLGGVIAEIWGDPSVMNFTATKRLALGAEARGVPSSGPAPSRATWCIPICAAGRGRSRWTTRAPAHPTIRWS